MWKLADNILSWCAAPEEGAIQQAKNISRHPCLIGNVCLMPDTHEGYGMPIGGVVALDEAICPNMVGVDIGCGMLAVKTNVTYKPTHEQLRQIVQRIREAVPVGFSHQSVPKNHPIFDDNSVWDWPVCRGERDNARVQLGTLGGGNHFIELQWDEKAHCMWFMIHSGSRNLGKRVANHYNRIAKDLCKMWRHTECVNNDLAFLPRGDGEDINYREEMNLCVKFALANREEISMAVGAAISAVLPGTIVMDPPINIAHNYTTLERHYGRNVWVHRKGATLARSGITGIIPGSQGSCSYIVEGLGNEASLCSCSHGAGRRMSRTKARTDLDLTEEIASMNARGIVHNIRSVLDLDEAPSAYKDIDTVMSEQSDLVRIVTKLEPMAVVKG